MKILYAFDIKFIYEAISTFRKKFIILKSTVWMVTVTDSSGTVRLFLFLLLHLQTNGMRWG